jgi:phage gp36-like protein
VGHPYGQRTDLNLDEQRLAELTDDTGQADTPNEALISSLGEQADTYIDEALQGTYVTPLADPPPAAIRYIRSDLLRYAIYQHRPELEMPKQIDAAANAARQRLREFAEGAAPLAAARVAAQAQPYDTAGELDTDTDDRLMGRRKDVL